MKISVVYLLSVITSVFYPCTLKANEPSSSTPNLKSGFKVIENRIIYKDTLFYSSFPSIIKRPDGSYFLSFRRAPERKIFHENGTNHVDANSYLMKISSPDGVNWDQEPELLYAYPFGGSQDPCLFQLKNGELLCTSYAWAPLRPSGLERLKRPNFTVENFVLLGGYLIRSNDGGHSWSKPYSPPHIEPEIQHSPYGTPIPAYNRGGMFEDDHGTIFWAVAATDRETPWKTSVHLLSSEDKGFTWKYQSPIAVDDSVSFNETSVYKTAKGDLVAFLRTADYADQACIARSTDNGKTFQPWESMGFQGHPINALELPDKRVLITYGYRHKPFGIRARILNAECTDFKTAEELILCDDGGSGDIGYSWPVLLDNNRVLVVYYFNKEKGTRYIAGTIVEIEPASP